MPGTRRRRSLFQPGWLTLVVLVIGLLAAIHPAQAQIGSYRYSSIVIDARTGAMLSGVNIDEPRYPASLVKVMTIYMVFEAVRDRRISFDQYVPVSAHASSMSPTKLGLMPGTRITVEQAVLGLVTKSANDAAAALAELLGGTEDRFAQMMTLRARALGMSNTRFENASGLPDLYQVTTARDMALMARRLMSDFPTQYRYFATEAFNWHGRTMHNHHQLLHSYPGADGLKTGYTNASGYNLITSAVRGGVRLIGVVMGGASGGERDHHMVSLLNDGFERLNIPTERRTGMQVAQRSVVPNAQAAPAAAPTRAVAPPVVTPPVVTPAVVAPPVVGSSKSVPPKTRPATAWAIQVGSFPAEQQARSAAAAARRLTDDGDIRVTPAMVNRKPVWRAQLVGLSAAEAQSSCQTLNRRKAPCMIIRPEQQQVAAR